MTERMTNELMQFITINGARTQSTDDMLDFIKAEREYARELEAKLLVAETSIMRWEQGWGEPATINALKDKLDKATASGTAAYNAYEGEFWKCRKAEAALAWLDNNTTFCDDGKLVLASVTKRIWYHATDDTKAYPFSKVIQAALNQEQK